MMLLCEDEADGASGDDQRAQDVDETVHCEIGRGHAWLRLGYDHDRVLFLCSRVFPHSMRRKIAHVEFFLWTGVSILNTIRRMFTKTIFSQRYLRLSESSLQG